MIRISKIFFGIMAVCLLLLPACTEPMSEGIEKGIADASALTLSLSVDGMGVEVATRMTVDAINGEDEVHSLTLFFFEPSKDRSGQLVTWVKLGSDDTSEKLSMNTPIPLPIPEGRPAISASEAYNVIGVANAAEYMYAGWESEYIGKSEAEFRQNTKTVNIFPLFASNDLLMNGTAVKTAGNGHINMKLTRNVIRVDVECKATGYQLEVAKLSNICNFSSVTGDGILDYSSENIALRGAGTYSAVPKDKATIKGELYAFENRSTSPSQNDKVTTCVLLGLRKNSYESSRYYRINIHPEKEGQYLRRNNVYSISINNVNGDGYASREDAFSGTKENELDYTINNWDLGDNGLIVSDSYSILALPVKVAQIGTEGGTFNYNITTFSTLESPSPLRIKSITLDDGLTVSLDGNTLTIEADLLPVGQVRNGKVTLTYAGLEATMEIEQSLKVNAFLKIVYADGWSGLLPASAGNETKNIQVFASGSWKATIIGDDGFSFSSGSTDIANSTSSGEFKVKTISDNPSKTNRRNAFVIVTLDADPINCAAVVSLAQSVASNITISPLVETVIFEGSQSNLGTGDNVKTFTVSASDDSELSVSLTEGVGKFGFTYSKATSELKIYTLTANNSSSSITGKLKISGGASELVLNLIQKPLKLSVITTSPTTVGPEGGKTGEFYLSDNSKSTVSLKVNGVGRNVYNHDVKLIDAATGDEVVSDSEIEAGTKLKIEFDKIAFPNREIEIKATVTFTTTTGGAVSYTFTQSKLTARGVNIWNLRGSHYGSLSGSHFIDMYRDAIRAFNGTFTNNTAHTPPSTYPGGTTYIHVGNQFTSAFNWTAVNSFLTKEDGIVVLTNDEGGTSLNKGNELLRNLGYSNAVDPKKVPDITVASGTSSSRVGLFMTTYGKTQISNPGSIPKYYSNSILTCMPSTSSGLKNTGGTGVALLTSNGGSEIYLMVDPAKKFVYIGEIEVFNHDSYLTNGRKDFMNNFVQYVANAARYGSHFTEMLIDSSSIEAPWDEVWGDNRWPLRSN